MAALAGFVVVVGRGPGAAGSCGVVEIVRNAVSIGKLLGVPYIPVTPWLFAVPIPAKLEVYYSEPMVFEGTGSEEDEVVSAHVEKVKERIAELIDRGRRHRRGEPARDADKQGAT